MIVIQVKFAVYTKFSFNVVKPSGYKLVLNLDCSRFIIAMYDFKTFLLAYIVAQSLMHTKYASCI